MFLISVDSEENVV